MAGLFDIRQLLPRKPRVILTPPQERRRKRQRHWRDAHRARRADNPAGAKVMRKFAEAAGMPSPTYRQALEWYRKREEPRYLQGQRVRILEMLT